MAQVNPEKKYKLIGTYTRYSSWTSRVQTVLEYFKIPYEGSFHPLHEAKQVSQSGLVPVLLDPSLSPTIPINDSLAIVEYLAESHPSLPLYPADPLLRALARSAIAEIHSGLSQLRTFDTNYIAHFTGPIPVSEAALKDIKRVLELWSNARKVTKERLGAEDEGFLFGKFGIADAFFWPVLWRFRTYNLPLNSASEEAIKWISKMWNDPALKTLGRNYFEQAKDPNTRIEKYDEKFKGIPEIAYEVFEEDWEFDPK